MWKPVPAAADSCCALAWIWADWVAISAVRATSCAPAADWPSGVAMTISIPSLGRAEHRQVAQICHSDGTAGHRARFGIRGSSAAVGAGRWLLRPVEAAEHADELLGDPAAVGWGVRGPLLAVRARAAVADVAAFIGVEPAQGRGAEFPAEAVAAVDGEHADPFAGAFPHGLRGSAFQFVAALLRADRLEHASESLFRVTAALRPLRLRVRFGIGDR